MSLQKTEAVVLKVQKLGETSKILVLYSKKYGKIKVVAKGSRGLKSRFYGTLEPINHIFIVYYLKDTRELQLLSQAEIVHPFNSIREDLTKYAVASVFCELIERTQLQQPNPYLFHILIDVLSQLDQAEKNILNYYFWFILKFLQISGFNPRLDYCQMCKTRQLKQDVSFSMADGSFTCAECSLPKSMNISASPETIYFLQKLQHSSASNVGAIENPTAESCDTILLTFLQYHIEETKKLKSLKFLKHILNQHRV